jgi:hypothetical protein
LVRADSFIFGQDDPAALTDLSESFLIAAFPHSVGTGEDVGVCLHVEANRPKRVRDDFSS